MRLAELPVLFLDAQATAADPARGALLEIGWACARSGEADHASTGPSAEPTTHVVAPPPGAFLPPAVARITGLSTTDWTRGIAAARAWECLVSEAESLAPAPVPTVVHFARFEEPFLRALHQRHGSGAFPLDLVCTHAIARRLLAELPRRTLRALAGYFGAGIPPLRRCGEHVAATAFVWRHLLALLAEREGVFDMRQLREWLSRPARRAPRRFPLPPERRKELPDAPGVYRLLRAGGAVLYVGKAASLRQRVRGHFHAGCGERALEMLTQARDVACTQTETALEAALLETDEIKRLAPPFNLALAAGGHSVCFATPDLRHVRQHPDRAHSVGPFFSAAAADAFAGLRDALRLRQEDGATRALRARAVGVEPARAPGHECFAAGLARFLDAYSPVCETRELLRLGGRLWASRPCAQRPHLAEPGIPGSAPQESAARLAGESRVAPEPSRPDGSAATAVERRRWDPERVTLALEETLVRAAHAVRRGRWLVRLSECSLAWAEPGAERLRLLVIQGGAVVERGDLAPDASAPVPPGHARTPAERRTAFDVATFDRLRVLTTELRTLAAASGPLELRFGRRARLSRRRLQAVLRWV